MDTTPLPEGETFRRHHPRSRLDESFLTGPSRLAVEVWRHRWQIGVMFRRDFVASYRRTVLGFAWAVILPLLPISTYVLLAAIRVVARSGDMPFVVYIVLGVTIWSLLAQTITSLLESIRREGGLLARSRYPMAAVMLASLGREVFDTLVRLACCLVVLALYGFVPGLSIVLLPLVLLPAVLFAAGLGMLAAVINVIAEDVKNVVTVVLRYGIFLSAVIFPMPETGVLGAFDRFNPFSTYVDSIRQFVVFGTFPEPGVFAATAVASALLFLVGCRVLYVMEDRLRPYLG